MRRGAKTVGRLSCRPGSKMRLGRLISSVRLITRSVPHRTFLASMTRLSSWRSWTTCWHILGCTSVSTR